MIQVTGQELAEAGGWGAPCLPVVEGKCYADRGTGFEDQQVLVPQELAEDDITVLVVPWSPTALHRRS